jgi:hypothetical protein
LAVDEPQQNKERRVIDNDESDDGGGKPLAVDEPQQNKERSLRKRKRHDDSDDATNDGTVADAVQERKGMSGANRQMNAAAEIYDYFVCKLTMTNNQSQIYSVLEGATRLLFGARESWKIMSTDPNCIKRGWQV